MLRIFLFVCSIILSSSKHTGLVKLKNDLPPGQCAKPGVGCSDCQFCPDGRSCNLCPVLPGWCPGFNFQSVGCSGCQFCPDGSLCNLCTAAPTLIPTFEPSSLEPTLIPTIESTYEPTVEITYEPSVETTFPPQSTFAPSSDEPELVPASITPTTEPTVKPTRQPLNTIKPFTIRPFSFVRSTTVPSIVPNIETSIVPTTAPNTGANANSNSNNSSSSGLSQSSLIAMIVVLCFACLMCVIFAAFIYSSRRRDSIKKDSELQDWTNETDHPVSPRFRALSAALSPSKLFSRKTAEVTPAV